MPTITMPRAIEEAHGAIMLRRPYLLFLGDATDDLAAKTARGVRVWRPTWCVGQLRLDGCGTTVDLQDMTIGEAVAAGAKTLLVGVANRGGVIPEPWRPTLREAVAAGLDIASGLHDRLDAIPGLSEAAQRQGTALVDLRHLGQRFPVGTGVPRTGKRLLTVGTDCSVGKMYTALALEMEMRARGWNADFRATGQTGMFIAGKGIAVDAVIADFIAGAVEWLTPPNAPDHWDLIEGQGSLAHPSYAGVSLGLLHGAQPDALVLCHVPARPHLRGLPGYPVPTLEDTIEANLVAARLTNASARFVGIAMNTTGMERMEADALLRETAARLRLPCVDPVATGVAPIVDHIQGSEPW